MCNENFLQENVQRNFSQQFEHLSFLHQFNKIVFNAHLIFDS